jgi:hypothetical protein
VGEDIYYLPGDIELGSPNTPTTRGKIGPEAKQLALEYRAPGRHGAIPFTTNTDLVGRRRFRLYTARPSVDCHLVVCHEVCAFDDALR